MSDVGREREKGGERERERGRESERERETPLFSLSGRDPSVRRALARARAREASGEVGKLSLSVFSVYYNDVRCM